MKPAARIRAAVRAAGPITPVIASGGIHNFEQAQAVPAAYCEALDQRHRQVTCEPWDREGLDDPSVKRSADGKRRSVAP